MSTKASNLGRMHPAPLRYSAPLYFAGVPAGFPSPADDYVDRDLDLNEHLIAHPAATYFVRASGNSMSGAGIHDGDLLIVDRAVEPKDGSIVIAVICGDLTVKRLHFCDGRLLLEPDNNAYSPIEVAPEMDFQVWGVCRHVIHTL